jgi:formylglycine-generating enzyme required for sulfatase activity
MADRTAASIFQSIAVADIWPNLKDWPELDDGYALHAPVGTYRPNACALHDMAGNVTEQCGDWYCPYHRPVKSGDGERHAIAGQKVYRAQRGGSFYCGTYNRRSSCRMFNSPTTRHDMVGLRPARPSSGNETGYTVPRPILCSVVSLLIDLHALAPIASLGL